MEFKVSAKALYSTLSGVSKVINSKNTLMILDNFLLRVEDNLLVVTASDTENTLVARLALAEVEGSGSVCVNARRLADIAKELPDVDVTFSVNDETLAIKISFPGGAFDLVASTPTSIPPPASTPPMKTRALYQTCSSPHRRFSTVSTTRSLP